MIFIYVDVSYAFWGFLVFLFNECMGVGCGRVVQMELLDKICGVFFSSKDRGVFAVVFSEKNEEPLGKKWCLFCIAF